MTKKEPKPVRVKTNSGDVLRISGKLPEVPEWAKGKPMPEAPSQKYTEEGDNL